MFGSINGQIEADTSLSCWISNLWEWVFTTIVLI